MTLRLSLLGTPLISVDGQPVEFDTRKAVALLAYLAVTGQPHGRDALALLLWPEYDTDHARSALRRTLSTTRKGLGDRWVAAGRHVVHLQPAGAEVDVERFRVLIRAGEIDALADAVALYRGDFMSGFALRDSAEFDDWQFAQAEELRRDLARGLERLSRAQLASGEERRAIENAHHWLALDSLSEAAHRWLMELYARSGDRTAAIRQYRECVRVLDEELGVPPLPETTELYRTITEDGLQPLRPPPPPAARVGPPLKSPAATPGEYPLVGRSVELEAVIGAYELSAQGDSGAVIGIEGEPGIGKTRLAQELIAVGAERGARRISVRCHEGEQGLAYAPWIEALPQAVGMSAPDRLDSVSPELLAEAALLAPELREHRADLPAPLAGHGAQARLFEGVSQIIAAALDGDPPGILVLDDLQWADAATIDLLAYLVRRLPGRRLCVVACRRPEAVHDGGAVDRLFAELDRRGSTLLRLGRLTQADIGALVRSIGAPTSLVERLATNTEGVPYFLVEYLAALTGAEAERTGSVPVPQGVRSLLQSRIGSLGETARQLLTAASVIGRSFDADLARETSGRGDEETVGALEELTDRALIRAPALPDGPLLYDFTHDQLRQLVYEETSLPRRRLLHKRVADALAQRGRRRRSEPAAAVIAGHYQLAGEEEAAVTYHLLAGDVSRRVHANGEALGHYRAALALGADDAAALHEAIGDLETLAGDYEQALADYETAAASAPPDRMAGLEHKLGILHQRRGAWSLAESHFRRSLELLLQDEPGNRARVKADQSLNAYRQGDRSRAMRLARDAMALARRADDAVALAQVHNIIGILESSRKSREPALRHLTESLRLAEQLSDVSARVAALNNLALVQRAAGNLDRAIELTRSALDECIKQGDRHREAALHNNLADLLHRDGRRDEAMKELKSAVAIFAEIGEVKQADELQPEIWKLVEW